MLLLLYLRNCERLRLHWNFNDKSGIQDHRELEQNVDKWLQQRPTTGRNCCVGRLRQRPTTRNDNINVSSAYLAFFAVILRRSRVAFRACEFRISSVGISTLSDTVPKIQNYFRVWRPYRYIRLSISVAISCRHFFELYMVVSPRFAVGIVNAISHSFRNIKYFRFWRPFRVVDHYSNRSPTSGLPLEFWWYLSYLRRHKYFRFWQPYCYFWLSVVFEITLLEIAMADSSRFAVEKRQIWRFSKNAWQYWC